MTSKKQDSRCQGQNKAGRPCGAAATSGGLCFFHSSPNKAVELGRIGGSKKSRPPAEATESPPKLDKAIAVRDAVEKLIADVLAGKLHPRIAAGLAPLLSLQLRVLEAVEAMEAMEATNLKGRLERVEERLARDLAEDGLKARRNTPAP